MRVLLLAGGKSGERAVSLTSGKSLYESLVRLGHTVTVVDPYTGRSLLDTNGQYIGIENQPSSQSIVGQESSATELTQVLAASQLTQADVVFLGLHGGDGENGTIQNLLTLAGVPFTGSGMKASAVAMDKALTKRLMHAEHIRTPNWILIADGETVKVKPLTLQYPVIVKPNEGGSTVGLTKVDSADGLPDAIKLAALEPGGVLIEEFIPGRELTVAVLDGEALPIVEIRPKKGLYDYEAKYTKGASEYIVPAPIDKALSDSIQSAAARLFAAIGCQGLARIDFIITKHGEYYCLEVNTLPGMTNLSLAPMAAKAIGIPYDELVNKILSLALDKHRRKSPGSAVQSPNESAHR